MAKTSRFEALRQLRDERQQEEHLAEIEQVQDQSEPLVEEQKSTPSIEGVEVPNKAPKRGPGRPPGRRSNPNYTQISAYIPLNLLQEVQDVLAKERRQKHQRTARPVSDLVEELLANWLKQRENT